MFGYRADEDRRLLVYEHMARGSLDDHLLGTNVVLGPHAPLSL